MTKPVLRLRDLHPEWLGVNGDGIRFDCPACAPVGKISECSIWGKVEVHFKKPLHGEPEAWPTVRWDREGETFEALTLAPSIKVSNHEGEHWHGFVTNGLVTTC